MSYRNKKICIVGGGTTGWSAAAFFSKFRKFEVEIVEPKVNDPIGVGESTLPHLGMFHQATGFDVFNTNKWLDKVDGTGKFTIEFADFFKKNTKWVHPFFVNGEDEGKLDAYTHGLIDAPSGAGQYEWVNKTLYLAGLRQEGFKDTENLPYKNLGYHLDATLYAKLLKELSLTRDNVKLTHGTVTGIDWDREDIRSIKLDDGSVIQADYFLDATGFRSVLNSSKWVSYDKELYCDRAWTVQLPYLNEKVQKRNTTYCHGLENGWVWNVPLQSRIGTGYVHSSRHTTAIDAKKEFLTHLNKMYGYDTSKLQPRLVGFQSGHRKQIWRGNVISLGLAAFFIEPLESTAIALTQSAMEILEPLLTSDHLDMAIRRKRYNKKIIQRSLQTLDFISAHYKFSKRDDSAFWRSSRKVRVRPKVFDLLEVHTDSKRALTPRYVDQINRVSSGSFFGNDSWGLLFLAYGFPNRPSKHWKESRREVCMSCEHKITRFGLNVCSLCGCVVHTKTALKQSTCPDKRWGGV